MNQSKPSYLSVFALVVIIWSSCSSGKSAYEHGNYYDAVMTSVNRLRRNTDNKKSSETLRSSYPMAVRYYEDKANAALATNAEFKYREVVQHYNTLQTMYDEIQRSPGALRVIPNPNNYQTKLAEARLKAAEESYSAGIMALGAGDRAGAKKAYYLFIKANEYSSGYRDVAQKIEQARMAATVKVAIEPIPVVAKNYALDAHYFDSKLNEFLQANQTNEFVRYYKLEDARTQKITPDHIVKLSFEEFSIGQVYVNEKESQIERDSIVVAYTYTDTKGTELKKETEAPKIVAPLTVVKTTTTGSVNNGIKPDETNTTQTTTTTESKPVNTGSQTGTNTQSSTNTQNTTIQNNTQGNTSTQNSTNQNTSTPDNTSTQGNTSNQNNTSTQPTQGNTSTQTSTNNQSTTTSTPVEQKSATSDSETKSEVKMDEAKPADEKKADEKPAEEKKNEGKSQEEKSGNADNNGNGNGNKDQNAGGQGAAATGVAVGAENKDEKKEEQVAICHQPPGKQSERKTLTVPQSAVKAHLDHGDVLGECKDEKKQDNKGKDNKSGKDGGGMASLMTTSDGMPIMIASASNNHSWFLFKEVIAEGDTTKIYGKVRATVRHFKKTITSRGVLNFRIIDAKTKAVISEQRMPSESVWVSEWLTYNGDSRALSAEQINLAKQRELPQPTNQELFSEFTKPLFTQISNKITEFYKSY